MDEKKVDMEIKACDDDPKVRVMRELADLRLKMEKLIDFLYKPDIFRYINNEMYDLMKRQIQAMQEYAEILQIRLGIWQ